MNGMTSAEFEKYCAKHGIHCLSKEEYEKAVGQLRGALRGVFQPFNLYGLGVMIPMAIEEAVRLTEDFGLRVRGVDKAISIEMIRGRKR